MTTRKYAVQVVFCSGRSATFPVTLPSDLNIEKDLGGNLTVERCDVLVCDDGTIVAIPAANVEFIRYVPLEPESV